MADVVPHPLVAAVVAPDQSAAVAVAALEGADEQQKAADDLIEATQERVAKLAALVDLEGYIAAYVDHNGSDWMLLYLDRRLQNWVLIPESAVKRYERTNDELKVFRTPDIVWVKRDATLCVGRGAHTVELRFLSGTLTTAGELDQTLGSRGGGEPGLFAPSPPFCNCGSRTRG
jgi:hypothetical protein